MSDTAKTKKPMKESEDRQRLPHKVEVADSAHPSILVLTIMLVLLPYLALWVWEIAARAIDPPERLLPRPWAVYQSPYPPFSEFHWTGDLTRIARLPYYDRALESGPFPKRFSHRITDEWGYVNPPSGHVPRPVHEGHEYIVTGSSYMAEGSTIEYTLPEQLEKITGKPVYNAAWPGGSPVQGAVRLLTDPEFYQGRDQIVIFGVIQRYLYSWAFNDIRNYIDESGKVIKRYEVPQPSLTFYDYLEWRKQIENYLETTSVVRQWVVWPARFLPPMALDYGYDSPVRISWLQNGEPAPILFYPDDIRSTYHSFEDRGGEEIVQGIQRIARRCRESNLRLIMIFVPDKYEIYRQHLQPKLYPVRGPFPGGSPQHPERRAPQVLTERLHALGIEAIDLYDPLYAAQFHNGSDQLLFWVDDTHWSDAGIRVAAQTVADYLQEHPQP